MSAIKLVDVLCACGWLGTLASGGDCPTCGASASNRVTPVRLAVLQAFSRGEFPRLHAITRKWLRDRKLISVRPPLDPVGKPPARSARRDWQVTELGARVIAVATAFERRLGSAHEVETCAH
jgi:hypothetical protein